MAKEKKVEKRAVKKTVASPKIKKKSPIKDVHIRVRTAEGVVRSREKDRKKE